VPWRRVALFERRQSGEEKPNQNRPAEGLIAEDSQKYSLKKDTAPRQPEKKIGRVRMKNNAG
jgi:hypothetical protein